MHSLMPKAGIIPSRLLQTEFTIVADNDVDIRCGLRNRQGYSKKHIDMSYFA